MGFLLALIGIIMMFVGLIGSILGKLPIPLGLAVGGGGVVLSIAGTVMACMSFYKRTAADMAFVRTGRGGNRVVLDGGTMVIPIFHRMLEINLRTMKLGVNPRGQNALITR